MKFKERKYCTVCEAPFYFTSMDSPTPNEPCPINSEHSTNGHCVVSKEQACQDGFFVSVEDEVSTAETDWQDVLSAPVYPEEETDYLLNMNCEVYNSNNNAITCVRLIVDDVEKILSNVDCEVDGGAKLERLINGFVKVSLDSSQHTIKIQYKCRSGTAFIRRARLNATVLCCSEGGGYGYGSS